MYSKGVIWATHTVVSAVAGKRLHSDQLIPAWSSGNLCWAVDWRRARTTLDTTSDGGPQSLPTVGEINMARGMVCLGQMLDVKEFELLVHNNVGAVIF